MARKAIRILAEKPNKYRAVKTEVDGITFDSKREAAHYGLLKQRLLAGQIAQLRCQPSFDLIVNGMKIATYRADFAYLEVATGRRVVVDVKGVKTPVYKLKKKLVLALHGVEILEV